MAIISYADAYKKHLEEQKNADKKDIGLTRKYSLESGSDPGADIILGTLFMNPAKVARGISAASGKEMSEDAKKAVGWLSKVQGVDIGRGFFGAAEGITDFLAGGAAQIAGQKDAAKWIYEHSWSRDAVGADVTDEYVGDAAESKGYQLASDLLSGIGNVGFQIAVGTLIGGALAAPLEAGKISAAGAKAIQYAPLFFSASGSGTAENMQKTGELGLRENVGGLLKGGVEVLTEIVSPTGRITEAALFGKNAKGMSRYLVKHAVAKNILTNFAGEAGEEALSYVGDHYIEKWLKISDDKFSWGDLGYQAVLGGITGALFSSPSDISFVRQARKAGATVYAQGDAAVNNKINEGLIEVKLLKERGLNNDNVKLAEAALAKLTTDENLSQTTKEYYLGLAEQMVLKQNLSDQYNALAKELVAKAKADPATAQSMADAFNALVNEAGGEGKYTAADFTNENSEAARIYVVAQMANDWLSRSDAQTAMDEIMKRKAALYQGTAEQKNAIRSMEDGSTVAFRVGENAYAVVTKRAGTDTYSVGFTTPGQVESDGAVYATHKLSLKQVEELLSKPMTEQQIDAGIVENLAKKEQAEVKKEQKAEKKQAKTETKKKPAAKTTATETAEADGKAETEQTAKKTEPKAKKTEATTGAKQAQKAKKQTTKAESRKRALALRKAATQVLNMWKKDTAHFPLSIAVEKDGKYYLTGTYFSLVMNEESDFLYPAKIDVDIGGRNNSEIFGRDAAISSLKELGKVERAGGVFDRIQNAIDGATTVKVNAADVLNAVTNDGGKGVELYDGKGKAKKFGFVKIGGVSFNKDGVQTVLSAIENPTLFIGKMDKSPCLVIKGDNGSGMVLPTRISGRGEINAEEIEADGYVYTDGSKSISYSPATIVTEQTSTQEQTAEKVKPEDLSTVEKRLTSAFGIDGSEFTKEEWTKARECVPNIDGLTRREQARVLTLVRTAQANGINEEYYKGLARLSSVYGFGVVFEDIDVSGFYSRKHGMVVINPKNLDETFGHEIEHSFDQIVKEGKAEFRTDLSEKVKKIVGASVFDKAKAQYKADYEKLRARDGSVAELSEAELEAEATANVVGKYLSNMTLLKKLAATDYKLGRGLLAAIRRMKDKWTSAKAFAKENDSTAFAEYRKMTRIEKLLMQELAKRDARKAGDTAYSPATAESDSDGNTLSYGQQKYFARSKVRDANGRLLVVYHGTDADFDTFDLSRAGKNGRQEGFGFYFAANQEITRKYGDKQKKVYLNIEKPLYDNRRTVTKAELRKFANALVDYQVNENGENWRDTFISNYVDTYSTNRANAISQFVETVWEADENDQDLIYEIANGSGMNYDVDTMEPFYNVLYQSIGYDGNISTWEYVPLSGKKETNTIYVTFRPEQAKYVSNFEPTINTDLRYSPASVAPSVSPAGDTSSAAFKRWFGNSPFKNEDGTPKVYYHGAKKGGGFTVFRDWQYFTDKKQYAERYAERDNPNALYEVYLTADKVFDTRNADARKIFQSIRNEYGLSELQDTGLPDWTDGYDITEYLSEHPELGYDAVILDEGGDLVDGEPVSRGESIIIKDSAQVKSATDNIGTYDRANPDIRYSPVTPETDSRYLSLARDPQKNESELRRLVKEAAEKAGYTISVYHGTQAEHFTKFNPKVKSSFGRYKFGDHEVNYFTTDRGSAESYAKADWEKGNGTVYEGFVKAENPYVVDAKGENAFQIENDDLVSVRSDLFDIIEGKVSNPKITLESANRYLSYLGMYVREADGEYELRTFGNNSAYGSEQTLGYSSEIFDLLEDNEDDIKDTLGINDNWNVFNTDAIVQLILGSNEILGTDFDSVIINNVYDTASIFNSLTATDVITLKGSSQFKSADPVTYDDSGNIIPLSERFNPQNDDIRYSPAQSGSGRIVIQASQSRPTGREKLTNLKGELSRSNFRAALESLQVIAVNAQQGVENQLVRAGLTKREAAAFSQLARSGRSHAINAICYKLADMTGAIRSDGLIPILEPFLATKGEVYPAVDKDGNTVQSTAKGGELAGKRYSEFSDYYAMLHAIDRAAVGKNPYSSMTVAQMKQIVAEYEQKNPDFKAAAEKLSAFNSAMLDIEVQAGIISQETADLWRKQYPHYVPMYTQDSNAVGGKPVRGARNMEVRRDNAAATESDHRVSDPLRNYIDQVQRRIRAAKLNILLNEVYNSADGVNVVTAEADRAEAKDLREREQAYLENPESENDPAEMFRKFKRGKNTVNEVSFYKDGKRVTMAVTDRIYTGLSDLGGIHSSILDSWTVKAVKKVNDTFKKLVTNWNPFFAVKNIARDLQDGTLQSRFGMGEFLNMYRKNAEMMATGKYNDMWEEFLANGGLESSLYSDEFGTFTKGGKSGLEQATGIVGQFQHIKNFNTLTEALPRFTEYCLTRKHGGSVQTALLNAADVTVNFGRSGTLIRILNSTVSPFLNPAVQGLDRVIRLFTEDGIKNNKALASLLLKAVLLAIVPMALGNAMYGDDDEYKDMKDSIKENNYLFKVGDTWLKLPRGRVVSTISGLFNRSYKQLTGQETDWGDYGKNVLDQITPAQNVARTIWSPFKDVANNRTWYGTKIESDALQNYAVNQRYDENTSRISVWIGQLTSHFGLSPKEVNYLIDQYTGVIGDILLPTTTPAGTKGVVSYNFTVDPNASSNLSNRFYDLYNKTMYKSNDGDVEAYYLKKRLDETKSAVSELFKQIKTINASSELSNKEKVKQASAIRASINQLYKTALDDRRLYEQNIKDALAIENSYAVEKITAQSAKRYGLDSDAVGKYALTFGGDFAKQFNTEAQANDYKGDASKKTVYAEANRLTYGSEYALKEYSSTVYEKAQKLNELGISYDEYYNYYMTARYYSGKTKKQKILAYLNGSGLSKSQIALMMYYSGYTAYADEAKKAIKASSLSTERKKELLAGITN